jgi:hypothetical protein
MLVAAPCSTLPDVRRFYTEDPWRNPPDPLPHGAAYLWAPAALAWWEATVVPDPLKPIVDTSPAAHIAAIVSDRMRLGVSQPKSWVCIQALNPLAADAAVMAQPAHMAVRIGDSADLPPRLCPRVAGAVRPRGRRRPRAPRARR